MSEIFGVIDPEIGGWAVCVTVLVTIVTAVWRGWLIPRPTVDRLEKSWEIVARTQAERLTESATREKEWRGAWMTGEEKSLVRDRQVETLLGLVGNLLELARTTDARVRALLPAALPGKDAR